MHSDEENDFETLSSRPNKSALKREHLKLRAFVEKCVHAPKAFIDHLNFNEEITAELHLAKSLKGSAYNRQIKHVTNLISKIDIDFINSEIQKDPEQYLRHEHKKLEQIAKKLVLGNDSKLNDFIQSHPEIERQTLRQLLLKSRRQEDETIEQRIKPILSYLKQFQL